MKVIALLILATGSLCAHAQGDSTSISPFSLTGTWINLKYAYEEMHKTSNNGPQSMEEKRIEIPNPNGKQSTPDDKYFTISSSGRFLDARFYNAKWLLLGKDLIITPGIGPKVTGQVFRNDSTHGYRIILNGDTYVKTDFKGYRGLKE